MMQNPHPAKRRVIALLAFFGASRFFRLASDEPSLLAGRAFGGGFLGGKAAAAEVLAIHVKLAAFARGLVVKGSVIRKRAVHTDFDARVF